MQEDRPVVCCGDCLPVHLTSEDLHAQMLYWCHLNAPEFHVHASPRHFLKAADINKVSLRTDFCCQDASVVATSGSVTI